MKKICIILPFFLCSLVFGAEADSAFFGKISIVVSDTINGTDFSPVIKYHRQTPFDHKNYNKITTEIMRFPEMKGYYFPTLTLDKIVPKFLGDSLFINPQFILHYGELAKIDTLVFPQLDKTKPEMLLKDLKPNLGKVYGPDMAQVISQTVKKYPFLQFSGQTEIIKTEQNRFGLLVDIQEMPSNAFSGVVGYVPKTANIDGYFTGQLNIDLKNINGRGRGFKIYWSKVNDNSQELELNFFEPHLLKSQFFTNIGFKQVLRDTLLVVRNFNLGFGSNLGKAGAIGLTAHYETTLPTPAGRAILQLTKNKIWKSGFHYTFDNRDKPSNPSRGFFLETQNFLGYHQTESQQKILTQAELHGEYNISLPQQLVLNLRGFYRGKFIKDSKLGYSDLFWFGGATSLRGYPEDFFAGSEIGIIGGELRWITGNYSRVFAFIDQGFYKTPDNKTHSPHSFGIGLRLESRMGTIGLDYAFGEDDTFTTAKIHVLLENRF